MKSGKATEASSSSKRWPPSLEAGSWSLFIGSRSHPSAETWQSLAKDPKRGEYEPEYVFYLVLDSLLDEIFKVLDSMSDEVLKIENQIIGREAGADLTKLIKLKRSMVAVRRVLDGQRNVLTTMMRRPEAPLSPRVAPFFRDAYDHVVRAHEQVEIERDLLGNAMDAYISTASNRLNIVMKQLTILSAIFLPPTFITSFFGQNFSTLPFDSRTLFFTELAACIGTPLAMLYWFYKRRWL